MRIDRRQFLLAGTAVCTTSFRSQSAPALAQSSNPGKPKRVAFLGTEVRQHSHAQHFLDRLTEGYTWNGHWQEPRVEVASVYLDQFPEGDLGKQRIEKHQLKRYQTIEEALTLGGSRLNVDGVIIIAEHGDYPTNDKGQKRYPRYDWFKKVVKVFEDSRQAVPVFNDKHLSTEWDECVEMVEDSRRLKFPFLAGSSLPVTRRMPAIEMPYQADLMESVCVAYGGIDSYDIHALETAQCMSERRRGGEVGIRSVHALKGAAMWRALEADDREVTRRLIVSAFTRSHNLPVSGGFPTAAVTFDWAKKSFPKATAYFVEHLDGFRTTMLLTQIRDFNYAGYLKSGEIVSCQMYLPMPTHGSTTADFFNPLTRHIEDLVINRRTNYPVERTLLCSGMVIAGVNSLHQGQMKIETPKMHIAYSAPRASTYWRN